MTFQFRCYDVRAPKIYREGESPGWIPAFAGKHGYAIYRNREKSPDADPARASILPILHSPQTPPNPKHEAPR